MREKEKLKSNKKPTFLFIDKFISFFLSRSLLFQFVHTTAIHSKVSKQKKKQNKKLTVDTVNFSLNV
jgi:hypothetical protein